MWKLIIYSWIIGSTNPPVALNTNIIDGFTTQAFCQAAGGSAQSTTPADNRMHVQYACIQVQ